MTHKQHDQLQWSLGILAIFLVIFANTANDGFFEFVRKPTALLFYPKLIFSIVVAAGGNLLLMLLGAAQLARPRSTWSMQFNLILRLIIGILLGSVGYYTYNLLVTGNLRHFQLINLIQMVVQGPVSGYAPLYAIVSFLISLPILRLIATQADFAIMRYIFWLQLIFIGMFPIVIFFTGISNIDLALPLAIESGLFYPLMGYWLTNTTLIKQLTREALLVAWLLSAVAFAVMISVSLYQANLEKNITILTNQAFTQTFQAIPCLTVFTTMVVHVLNRSEPTAFNRFKQSWVQSFYGILLVAGILFIPLRLVLTVLAPWIGLFGGSVIWTVTTMVASYVVTIVLRRFKHLRRWLPSLFTALDQEVR